VAYEAIEIQLARPTTVDPHEAAERIVRRHRGGYCYHLNGAFSLLLEALGYDVVWHRAGVENHGDPRPPGPDRANHLALTVHGLEGGDWLVDVGLGDGPHIPLPLREGEYVQGPFRYRLRRSQVEPGGWRFDHDPAGSFAGMDFRAGRATVADFGERHAFLSTSPESGFVRTCAVYRRDAGGVDSLKGCVLRREGDGDGASRTIDTQEEWFDVLERVFGLPLHDVDAPARGALWRRVRGAHEAWLTRRRSASLDVS
jgi:N-hydroxyarylamine O-acetyltransferase